MYKPINGWTKQRILGHVKREFKGKSKTLDGRRCLYRGPNGTKCAIGMFIPDELYDTRMDCGTQNDLESLLSEFPTLKSYMPLQFLALQEFQSIHDSSTNETCYVDIIQWIDENVKG